MTKLRTFLSQSFRRKCLFLLTLALSFYTFLLMRFFQKYGRFDKKKRNSQVVGQPRSSSQILKFSNRQIVNDIRWAIAVVNKYVPWENVCRHQAYQAMRLCHWFGVDYQIFVGFKKNPQTAKVEGHAWCMAGGQMLTGFCNPEEYSIQQAY